MERDKHVGFVLQGFSDGGSTPPASTFCSVGLGWRAAGIDAFEGDAVSSFWLGWLGSLGASPFWGAISARLLSIRNM
jgi:hypothetical protein